MWEMSEISNNLRPFYDRWFTELTDWFDESPFKSISINTGYPKMNIQETEKELRIEAAIPGLNKEDVLVDYSNDILTISAKTQNRKEDTQKGYIVRELHKSSFSRSVFVPKEKFFTEKIDATLDNGILHVIIGKRKEEKREEGRKIEIK